MPRDNRLRMMNVRNRMLTFRVTDEEFDRLQLAANASGARCLSEFLRESALDALARWAWKERGSPNTRPPAFNAIRAEQHLEQRVRELENRIAALPYPHDAGMNAKSEG